jgi:membrane-bound lytic murein transglycosylase B
LRGKVALIVASLAIHIGRDFFMRSFIFAAVAAAFAFATPWAPALADDHEVIVSLYRAPAGQQIALLKWIADQDRAAVAAGVPAAQLYIHHEGASWDYMVINPATTPEQDKAIDAAAAKLGLTTGPQAGIEFRKYIAEHSDTLAAGPTTAADFLKVVK